MKNRELIEELLNYPMDANVRFVGSVDAVHISFGVNEGEDMEPENATDVLIGSQRE